MVTYCLSNYRSSWHVYRQDEYIKEVACSIPVENDAIRFAVKVASEETPSQVIMIDDIGRVRTIIHFPASAALVSSEASAFLTSGKSDGSLVSGSIRSVSIASASITSGTSVSGTSHLGIFDVAVSEPDHVATGAATGAVSSEVSSAAERTLDPLSRILELANAERTKY